MKPKPPTEKSIMLGIQQALAMRGWLILRMPPSIYSAKGIPDLYCCKDGKSMWIEVKREDGKLSPTQERLIQRLDDAGATVVIARSVAFAVSKAAEIENCIQMGPNE